MMCFLQRLSVFHRNFRLITLMKQAASCPTQEAAYIVLPAKFYARERISCFMNSTRRAVPHVSFRYVGTALCVTSICRERFHKHASMLTLFRTGSRVILNNIFLENNKDDNNWHDHEGCARHLQGKIPTILTFQ